jgi:acylphosphatase
MNEGQFVRVIAHVTGRVQGVSYRVAARREAVRLGLAGWARNEDDGSVTIDVEGQQDAVGAFLRWAAKGPPAAKVATLEQTEAEPAGRQGFTIC